MKSTLKNIIYYSCAVIIAKILGSFRTFSVAKILSPDEYGIWITVLLVISYAPIFCLGTVEALVKQVPYYAGEGDYAKAKQIDYGVFGSVILLSSLLLFICFAMKYIFDLKINNISSNELYFLFIAAAANLFYGYFYNRLIAYQYFKYVSVIDTLNTVFGFILIISFVFFLGLKGAIIGLVINQVLSCFIAMFLSILHCGKIRAIYNGKLILQLVQIGLPITFIWWIFMIQSSADRIISMSMLGSTSTGYYGIGIAFVSLVALVPDAVARVLYPKVNEKIGQNACNDDLLNIVVVPAQILSIIISFALAITISILPWCYNIFLQKYMPGINAAEILLLGSFFLCLIRIGTNLLIAMDLHFKLLKYFLLCLLLNIFGNIIFVKLGFGILGLSLSTSLSELLLSTLIWITVFNKLYENSNPINLICVLNLPFLVLLIVFVLKSMIFEAIIFEKPFNTVFHIIIFNLVFILIMFSNGSIRVNLKELYYKFSMNRRNIF